MPKIDGAWFIVSPEDESAELSAFLGSINKQIEEFSARSNLSLGNLNYYVAGNVCPDIIAGLAPSNISQNMLNLSAKTSELAIKNETLKSQDLNERYKSMKSASVDPSDPTYQQDLAMEKIEFEAFVQGERAKKAEEMRNKAGRFEDFVDGEKGKISEAMATLYRHGGISSGLVFCSRFSKGFSYCLPPGFIASDDEARRFFTETYPQLTRGTSVSWDLQKHICGLSPSGAYDTNMADFSADHQQPAEVIEEGQPTVKKPRRVRPESFSVWKRRMGDIVLRQINQINGLEDEKTVRWAQLVSEKGYENLNLEGWPIAKNSIQHRKGLTVEEQEIVEHALCSGNCKIVIKPSLLPTGN